MNIQASILSSTDNNTRQNLAKLKEVNDMLTRRGKVTDMSAELSDEAVRRVYKHTLCNFLTDCCNSAEFSSGMYSLRLLTKGSCRTLYKKLTRLLPCNTESVVVTEELSKDIYSYLCVLYSVLMESLHPSVLTTKPTRLDRVEFRTYCQASQVTVEEVHSATLVILLTEEYEQAETIISSGILAQPKIMPTLPAGTGFVVLGGKLITQHPTTTGIKGVVLMHGGY